MQAGTDGERRRDVGKGTWFTVGGILLLWGYREALLPLWVAAATAFLLDLPASRLERMLPLRRASMRRSLAVLLTLLLLGGGIVLLGFGMLPQLRRSFAALAAKLPAYLAVLEARMNALPINRAYLPDMDALWESFRRIGGSLLPGAWRVTKGIGTALADSITAGLTAVVLCLYFLFGKAAILCQCQCFAPLLPQGIRNGAAWITGAAREIFAAYLRSRILESGFLLLCCLPGLLLCRIPYALLFSV
ncbi:MAG: AI-2E family transporter, partial [Ruminococcaceae bacterium]|nr:AI-2E family transporter [Oscillospiraceae bacterium]